MVAPYRFVFEAEEGLQGSSGGVDALAAITRLLSRWPNQRHNRPNQQRYHHREPEVSPPVLLHGEGLGGHAAALLPIRQAEDGPNVHDAAFLAHPGRAD
jgi:hypothetical protein